MTREKPGIYYVLLSRKFWMSVIGLILILVTAWQQDPFPTDAVVTAIMGIVAAFVGATALEDGMSKQAESKATTTTVSTPGASDVSVIAPTDAPPTPDVHPTLGRMGG